MRGTIAVGLVVIAGCGADAVRPGTAGGAEARKPLVTAELIASKAAVAPGETLIVAVALTIAPGYHIYWTNPGDSGLATAVELKAPPGFVAGPARFPGPVAFGSPGELVSFGYAGEVAVSFEVAVPAELPGAGAEFAAAVDYVACQDDECVPGKVEARLTLPAGTAAVAIAPLPPVLARHLEALPRSLSAMFGASASWTGEPAARELAIVLPRVGKVGSYRHGGPPRYFPSAAEAIRIAEQSAIVEANLVSIKVRYKPGPALAAAGVVAAGDGRYYQIDLSDGGSR